MEYRLHCGNSLEIAKTLPENSIDTIITDPPYGLKFMGKGWDYGVPGVEFWREFLRVAKPGAMLFAFGGTRTFHRLTVAIEDAGWEIRDCMMWLYGSGFPKSHDISKAIDKQADVERITIGINPNSRPNAKKDLYSINGSKSFDISVPNTDAAKAWDGWGTALKPAWEPIIIAMKPLDGTFADNAIKHGVAGLHIDAGRIGTDEDTRRAKSGYQDAYVTGKYDPSKYNAFESRPQQGRWPANIILDEDSAALLDEQTGELKSGVAVRSKSGGNTFGGIIKKPKMSDLGYTDSGGASRFFYCAKASKKERGENNNHPTVKPLALLEYLCRLSETPTGGVVFDPFMGSGSTGIAARNTGRSFIGIDITPEYVEIAEQRIKNNGF